MTVKQFWESCKHNWPAKLTSFVLAVLLYFFYQNVTVISRSYVVPLNISSQGSMVPAGYHQPRVKVTLRTTQEGIAGITENDITAVLNLDYYTQSGDYNIPVQINISDTLQNIDPLEINVSPAVIPLKLAARAHTQVPVYVDLQGTPAAGYQVSGTIITPSSLGITGAEPVVDSVTELLTDAINVDGRKTSFTTKVSVRNDNHLVAVDGDQEVSVEVRIEPVTITRTFENQTVYLYGLNPLYIARFNPVSVTFSLSGTQNSLEKYSPELYTVRVDCSQITGSGTYKLPVEIIVPSGSRLVSQSASEIEVVVSAAEDAEENNTVSVDNTPTQADLDETL